MILDIRRCAQDGFLGASHSNTNHAKGQFFWVFDTFWSRGRKLPITDCYSIRNWRQKGNPWKSTNFKVSISGQGHDNCLLGPWGTDSCGCHAEWGDDQLRHLHQKPVRTQEVFWTSSASLESRRNLASAWHCKPAYKSGNSGSHHKIWLDSVTPSTLQPQSSNFWFPPIWSPDGCNPRYKFQIDEDV